MNETHTPCSKLDQQHTISIFNNAIAKATQDFGRIMPTDTFVMVSKDIHGDLHGCAMPAESLPQALQGIEDFLRLAGFVFDGPLTITITDTATTIETTTVKA